MTTQSVFPAAKDLFDECRATEECTVSNRYLQCANRLCVCTAPYVLSQHDECGPGRHMSRRKRMTYA